VAQNQPIRSGTGSGEIPDKLYFRIGEVARLCEVPAYVLRFWESEFTQLKPNKGGTGQRLYRRRDVEMALRVKTLLYDEGYTIPGARQFLKTEARSKVPSLLPGIEEPPDVQKLKRLRREMQSLLAMLQKPVGAKQSAAVHSIRPTKSRKGPVDGEPEDLFGVSDSSVDEQP
jgi:DNA-binding transcriptional MerR regulator